MLLIHITSVVIVWLFPTAHFVLIKRLKVENLVMKERGCFVKMKGQLSYVLSQTIADCEEIQLAF